MTVSDCVGRLHPLTHRESHAFTPSTGMPQYLLCAKPQARCQKEAAPGTSSQKAQTCPQVSARALHTVGA